MLKKVDMFISYSSKDRTIVEGIVRALEGKGISCWYAPRDVVGRYAKAICEAIDRAKVFLLVLTENAARSEHVLNEVEMAYNKRRASEHDIVIEPLCLGELDMDDSAFDEIMYYIRRINFISVNSTDSAQTIAREILKKNEGILTIAAEKVTKPREQSLYFASGREDTRLALQDQLLRKFDLPVYQKILKNYPNPTVLDVGCGNGNVIMNRLSASTDTFKLIGIERDEEKVGQANAHHGSENVSFYQADVEALDFADTMQDILEKENVNKFDVINISMLLLHLKSQCKLLRILRRLLKEDGIMIIKDIDDGINFAYPDEERVFERIYRICENNETSGERKNGRQIFTNLYRAGFKTIKLEKQGFSTIGMTYDEKEDFFNIYFRFILGDVQWMHQKYPENEMIAEDSQWYTSHYDSIFEKFMKDDFVFSLGFQIYVASKSNAKLAE